MGKYTRIYNRFEFWTSDDCSCEYCLYWKGARRGCSLTACSCEDIRQEAFRREQEKPDEVSGGRRPFFAKQKIQSAKDGGAERMKAILCPA